MLVRLLSVFLLLFSFILNPQIVSSYQTKNLCPFEPEVDDQILEIMEQHYIPTTTVAVVRNDSIIWAKGYGEQQQLDLIYKIASVTKTFTATAIFQLYERGVIDLDDDVNDYLPFSLRHPNYPFTPITIKMLLQHESGLYHDSDQYWYGMAAEILEELGWENPYEWKPYPYWIPALLTPNGSFYDPNVWILYRPGTHRQYSNFGYDVLGYLIWRASGKPIWEYFQDNIFDPLGMDCTGYNHSDFAENQLATPYIYMFELDPNSTGNEAYPHFSFTNYGCGGLRSNIYDLAKFLQVFTHDGVSNGVCILDEDTLREMEALKTAWFVPGDPWVRMSGWGGTEGDDWAYHAKGFSYYGGNTTVPYSVITFVNQGLDSARDAAFSITKLLQTYVHQYDNTSLTCTDGLAIFDTILISTSIGVVIVVLVIIARRRV